ncbi:MAG: peptidylprolyl isomerase [Clostridia bacterium]|jgi:peptidyl-prolyl cis-trans isomerase A (cyclophilin A)|nr:peptidylprolyl isomerase [Clostridia bacterium]
MKKIIKIALIIFIFMLIWKNRYLVLNRNFDQLRHAVEGEEVLVMNTIYGELKFRLFEKEAPKAVNVIRERVKSGYYSDMPIHRVERRFIIQTGKLDKLVYGKKENPRRDFSDEANNKAHHFRGALAFENSDTKNQGEIFIVDGKKPKTKDDLSGYDSHIEKAYRERGGLPKLDGKSTVFAQLYDSDDVLNRISKIRVMGGWKPEFEFKIIGAKIEKIK